MEIFEEPQLAIRTQSGSLYWCDNNGQYDDGRLAIYVKNGKWNGAFDGSTITPKLHQHLSIAGTLVWRGMTPFHEVDDALEWIDKQLAQGRDVGFEDDLRIGTYVYDPSYLEMRLRMRLTGTNAPDKDLWAAALRDLLNKLGTRDA